MPSGVYKHKPQQGFQKGYKHSKEAKEKIRRIVKRNYKNGIKMGFQKGNKLGIGVCGMKGKKHSIETRKKLSQQRIGKQPKNSINWKGKKHPLYGKKRYDMIGKNHWNWKGGLTKLRNEICNSIEYITWRRSVFERDNYTCQECGIKNKKSLGKTIYLESHHIKECYKIIDQNNIKTLKQALDCKELWCIDNGITLCKDCHNLTKKFIENQYVKRKS